MKVPRNSLCPCGSGRKYKRCCLANEQAAIAEERREDAVGRRITEWTSKTLGDEVQAALAAFDPPPVMGDADLQLFSGWFHNDRPLPSGATPAELYSRRTDIDEGERAVASRIAGARLGIHQVVEVEPGRAIVLVDQIDGARVRVASRNVSREPVRWDFLLARVMNGEPPTLWGPSRVFGAGEEDELFAELHRLARAGGESEDRDGLRAAMRRGSLELFRFRTPSATAERSFYTLEGDPMVDGRARWRLSDPPVARARLADLGGLGDEEAREEPLSVDITAPRSNLLAKRDCDLPKGAMVIERGAGLDFQTEAVASVSIEGSSLTVEAMSQPRLLGAVATIEADFGELLGAREELEMVPIDERLAEREDGAVPAHEPPDGLTAEEEREILAEYFAARYRGWIDDPNPQLGGTTPRQAARDGRREEVVRLAQRVENGAARLARESGIGAELNLLGELDTEAA